MCAVAADCSGRLAGRVLGVWFAVAGLLSPTAGRADDFDEAHAAYDRGAEAYDRGEYKRAATEFARADELAPNPIALEHALKAAVRADEPALGMTLVARSRRASVEGSLAEVVAQAENRFRDRVGRITVVCPRGASCSASIDGTGAPLNQPDWVVIGQHVVELSVDGKLERHAVSVSVHQEVGVTATPAAPREGAPLERSALQGPVEAPRGEARPRGISPLWFWAGVGVTAVLGGVAVASGVDAVQTNHDWRATAPGDDKDQLKAEGQSAETRTNVLLVATGAAAVATAVTAIFAVRWSSTSRAGRRSAARAVGLGLGRNDAASLALSGEF